MSESSGFMVAIISVSHGYSPDTPSLSTTTRPLATQSNSEASTLWSSRLTSSTYRMFPSACASTPFCITGRPSRMVASASMPPKSISSVTFSGTFTTRFPINPPAALARTVLADPGPPRISTVRMDGLTDAQRIALLASSIPYTAENGKLRSPAGISRAPPGRRPPPRTGASSCGGRGRDSPPRGCRPW